jgi:hypothetical protein
MIIITARVKVFSVFDIICLVAASNGGRSPSSGSPKCVRSQLTFSHVSQLQLFVSSTEQLVVIIQPKYGRHMKYLFLYWVFFRCRGRNVSTELFPSCGYCIVFSLHGCYLAIGLGIVIFSKRVHHCLPCKRQSKIRILLMWLIDVDYCNLRNSFPKLSKGLWYLRLVYM